MSVAERITTPFGFDSTALEVVQGVDLTGRTAVVTGASSGIGIETARALAATGASVTLAVRDHAAGEQVRADVAASTGNDDVRVAPLDLSDRASIAAFAEAWEGPLHLLVNNAGVMAVAERELTPEGWERQFGTNHMGHFALTRGLHAALAAAGDARVVSVSSSGHQRSPVIFDDLHFAFREYEPFAAYGQSKTANVLFAVAISERWAADGITANALMPGAILTNLVRHMDDDAVEALVSRLTFKTPEQGAATTALLATSPQLEGVGGRYFVDGQEAELTAVRRSDAQGVAAYALDRDNAHRLWDVSEALLADAASR